MNQRYFQWLVGDRRGEILVFEDIIEEDGIQFITFKDKSRINSEFVAEINQREVTGKMMAEIDSPRNAWDFKETVIGDNKPRIEQDWESQEKFEIPSVEEIANADGTAENLIAKPPPKKKKIELIPPRATRNKFGAIASTNDLAAEYNDTIANKVKVEQTTPEKPAVNSSDPVYIMMEKAKKVDTEVDMTLTISLPSAQLFDVVRDSFEDGDTKALEYIIQNIDITEIKEALKAGIKEMYGPNEDPTNNQIAYWNDEANVDLSNTDHWAYPTSVGEVEKKEETSYADGLFEPEVVQEPIVRDARPEEADEALTKELQEKAEKINQENE